MDESPHHPPDESSPGPSKAAKLLALIGFYGLLFFLAGLIGLPLPTGLAFTFFVSIAAPIAFIFSLLVVLLFRFVGNLSGRRRPLFDIGLQTFLLSSLIVTGLFIARFPDWLRTNLPNVQAELESRLSLDHSEAEKKRFLESFGSFWRWNVDYLLSPDREPTEVQAERLQNSMNYFGEALSPACDDCEPELTREESARLVTLMNSVTGYDSGATAPADAAPTALGPASESPGSELEAGVTTSRESPGAATGTTSTTAPNQP